MEQNLTPTSVVSSPQSKNWLIAAMAVNFMMQIFYLLIAVLGVFGIIWGNNPGRTLTDNLLFFFFSVFTVLYFIGLVGMWKWRKWGIILFLTAFFLSLVHALLLLVAANDHSAILAANIVNLIPLWLIVVAARHKDSFR